MWIEKASEGFVSLAYGPLDPAKSPTLFCCPASTPWASPCSICISRIDGVKPGEALTIAL